MSRHPRTLVTLAVAALALSSPMPVAADTEGLVLGIDLLSSRLGSPEGSPDDPLDLFVDRIGGGMNAFIGWGFGPSFPVRLSLAAAGHPTNDPQIDVAYGALTIDGMYLFRNPEPMRPYLYGGFGGFALAARQPAVDWTTTGPGVLFGGGIFYFVGDTFALDFSVRGEFVNWERTRATRRTESGTVTVETPIQEEGRAAKVLLGASWWL